MDGWWMPGWAILVSPRSGCVVYKRRTEIIRSETAAAGRQEQGGGSKLGTGKIVSEKGLGFFVS